MRVCVRERVQQTMQAFVASLMATPKILRGVAERWRESIARAKMTRSPHEVYNRFLRMVLMSPVCLRIVAEPQKQIITLHAREGLEIDVNLLSPGNKRDLAAILARNEHMCSDSEGGTGIVLTDFPSPTDPGPTFDAFTVIATLVDLEVFKCHAGNPDLRMCVIDTWNIALLEIADIACGQAGGQRPRSAVVLEAFASALSQAAVSHEWLASSLAIGDVKRLLDRERKRVLATTDSGSELTVATDFRGLAPSHS